MGDIAFDRDAHDLAKPGWDIPGVLSTKGTFVSIAKRHFVRCLAFILLASPNDEPRVLAALRPANRQYQATFLAFPLYSTVCK